MFSGQIWSASNIFLKKLSINLGIDFKQHSTGLSSLWHYQLPYGEGDQHGVLSASMHEVAALKNQTYLHLTEQHIFNIPHLDGLQQ